MGGVQRNVNIGLLDRYGDGAQPGDWVLIHVGFALSKLDEEEATQSLERGADLWAGMSCFDAFCIVSGPISQLPSRA